MKYIRTKDYIYDLTTAEKPYSYDNHFFILNSKSKGRIRKDKITKHIIAQADTIEELCDEFVIWFGGKYHIVFDKNNLLKNVDDIQKMLFGGAAIYGAIWTDKGLIYVAKMNEKCCLELL